MKSPSLRFITLSFCATAILFNNIAAEKKQPFTSFTVVPAQESSIKAVVFDLGDVLITPSRTTQATLFMRIVLQHPSVLFYIATKRKIKELVFNFLNDIPAHTSPNDQVMYNQGKLMPQIMVDWQTGYPIHNTYIKALTFLAESNHSFSEKILISKIIQLIFQPRQLIQALQPIQPMIKIAYALKKHGYKLYILSNWDAESFPLLTEKYQSLFNIFDGIMISGTEGIGKPNPLFYKNFLKKHNLNPQECIFIDDEKYNITAACNLGIHGVLNKSFNSTCFQLKNFGILQPIK